MTSLIERLQGRRQKRLLSPYIAMYRILYICLMKLVNRTANVYYPSLCITPLLVFLIVQGDPFMIKSDVALTWREAFHYCKDRNMRMISWEDFSRKELIRHSRTWLGIYQARTDFLTDIGCYQVKRRVKRRITTFSNDRMSKELCFFKCLDAKSKTTYLGLQNSTCVCLENSDFKNLATRIESCQQSCSKGPRCGNNATSVYKIEKSVSYDQQKGWCGFAIKPFTEIKLSSCGTKKQFHCDEMVNKCNSSIQSVNPLSWSRAMSTCACDFGTSMAALNDYKTKNATDEYWIPTRIYQANFDSKNILVHPEYILTCSVSFGDFHQTEKRGCRRQYFVICIGGITHGYNPPRRNYISISIIVGCTLLGVIFFLLAVSRYFFRKKKRSRFSQHSDVWLMTSKSGDTQTIGSRDSNYDYIPDDLERDDIGSIKSLMKGKEQSEEILKGETGTRNKTDTYMAIHEIKTSEIKNNKNECENHPRSLKENSKDFSIIPEIAFEAVNNYLDGGDSENYGNLKDNSDGDYDVSLYMRQKSLLQNNEKMEMITDF